jgi:hypothetical protein
MTISAIHHTPHKRSHSRGIASAFQQSQEQRKSQRVCVGVSSIGATGPDSSKAELFVQENQQQNRQSRPVCCASKRR